jgi:hypothetical protein
MVEELIGVEELMSAFEEYSPVLAELYVNTNEVLAPVARVRKDPTILRAPSSIS